MSGCYVGGCGFWKKWRRNRLRKRSEKLNTSDKDWIRLGAEKDVSCCQLLHLCWQWPCYVWRFLHWGVEWFSVKTCLFRSSTRFSRYPVSSSAAAMLESRAASCDCRHAHWDVAVSCAAVWCSSYTWIANGSKWRSFSPSYIGFWTTVWLECSFIWIPKRCNWI